MKRILSIIGVLIVLLSMWGISAETTHAAPLSPTVGINGDVCEFDTIRDAIDAAPSGSTIFVGAGTYYERLGDIPIDLTFVPSTIPTASNGGCKTELMTATSFTVQIRGDGVDVAQGGLVHVTDGANVLFRHMLFRNVTVASGATGPAVVERGGNIAVSNGGTLILDDANVLDGNATEHGGGIYVHSNLNSGGTSSVDLINFSNVYRNKAAGNGGGIYLERSELHASNASNIGLPFSENASYFNEATNGGGIYAIRGKVTLDSNSTVQRNEASGNGGGLYLDETELVIEDSLILDNKAIAGEGNGGGIWFELSTFSSFQPPILTDVTIAENVALNNGGGIFQDGHYVGADIDYTITRGEIRDNTAVNGEGGGAHLYLSGESVTTLNNVMVKNNFAHSDGGGIHAEMRSPATLTVSSGGILSNTATTGSGGGISWMRGTVSLISTDVSGNKANVTGGGLEGWDATITCQNSDLERNSAMQFTDDPDDDPNRGGTVYLELGNATTFSNCNFRENSSAGTGGALYDRFSDTIMITGGVIEDNVADSSGGAIYAIANDLLVLDDVELNGNKAASSGGAIMAFQGAVITVRNNSKITRNEALQGAGIYCYDSIVTVEDSEITRNTATHATSTTTGGGMRLTTDCKTTLLRSEVSNNSADRGGGVYALVDGYVAQFVSGDSSLLIDDVTFDNNKASDEGGGLFLTGQSDSPGNTIMIKNSEIINHGTISSAPIVDGGGIYADSVLVQLENVSIRDNEASRHGGGLYSEGSTVRFTSNPATCNITTLAANRYCSEMIGNVAGGDGGAIYIFGSGDNASTSVQSIIGVGNTALISNKAPEGAAVYSWKTIGTSGIQSTVMMTNALVVTNQHPDYSSNSTQASAIELLDDTVLIARSSTIANNFGKPLEVIDTVATVNVLNSIFYANLEGPSVPAGVVLGTSCNISQFAAPGAQSLGMFADPQFTFTSRGNFRLAAGSPAVDACSSGTATDLDDFGRPGGSSYDMGAFERNGVPTAVGMSNQSANGAGYASVSLMLLVLLGLTGVVWFRPKLPNTGQD